MWNRKVFIRIVEVLLCIACVVALRVTDDESRRVFHYLRNRSREWSLLNNVTWGTIGAALATATCGGYVIITTGLLIAAATGELKGRKTELFFLGLGVILFAIVGALSLASIESVPDDLIDNAAVLGGLCLFTALIFIADLLMSLPKEKKQDAAQTLIQKDSAKPHVITAMTTEKERKSSYKQQTNGNAKTVETDDVDGAVNGGFEKPEEQQVKVNLPEKLEEHEKPEQDHSTKRPRSTEAYQEERNRSFEQVERELREYTQNFENGRALRDSQRFRDSEMLQRSARGESMDAERQIQVYRAQDIYQRPIDEIDTPRFPTEIERRDDPMFARMVNPGVKIMKVEHDVDDAFDAYRYSDMSQYDNVPIKMRGASPGILKKSRDVSFNVPPPPKNYLSGYKRDDIEMLEKSFTALRTTSTGTQTGARTPSSPNDPGYVRHTASNWPQDFKTKTPGSSPEHSRD